MRLWPPKKVYVDDLPPTHDLRFGVVFILVIGLILGALYGVGYVVAGDRVPRGSTVAGIDIGSLTRGEAETELRAALVPRLQRPIRLDHNAGSLQLDLQEAGVTLDIESTVAEAMSGSDWDLRHMFAVLVGGDEVDPVVDIDADELERAIEPVVAAVRVAPIDSTVGFGSGAPRVVPGRVGETVDVARLQVLLSEAVRDDARAVRVPMTAVEPALTARDAERFLQTVARPAVSAPIRLRTRNTQVTVPPVQFAAALRASSEGDRLRLDVDGAAAYRLAARSRAELPGQPVDARVVLREGRPVVLPGRPGLRVTPQAWAAGVLAAASRSPGHRSAQLALVSQPPAFSTEEAAAMRVRTRVARYSVRVPADVDRAEVRQAVRAVDGVVLRPGGGFSYLRRAPSGSPRSARIVATATYNAALLSGLEVVARASDRTPPVYVAAGREARVARPRSDLVLHNQLPYGVLLDLRLETGRSGGVVRVEAWSTRFWQVELRTSNRREVFRPAPIRRSGPRCERTPGTAGYVIELVRIRERGDQFRRDVFTSRYAALRGVMCAPGGGRPGP